MRLAIEQKNKRLVMDFVNFQTRYFKTLNVNQWKELIEKRPALKRMASLYPEGFYCLFLYFESKKNLRGFIEHCYYLQSGAFFSILEKHPEFLKEAIKYNNRFLWSAILALHPEMIDKCKVLDTLRGDNWLFILSYQPQFAEMYAKKLLKISDYTVGRLLKKQPQLWEYIVQGAVDKIVEDVSNFDKSKCLKKFSFDDWFTLIMTHESLIEKCPLRKFEEFTNEHWTLIIDKYQSTKYKCFLERQKMISCLHNIVR